MTRESDLSFLTVEAKTEEVPPIFNFPGEVGRREEEESSPQRATSRGGEFAARWNRYIGN